MKIRQTNTGEKETFTFRQRWFPTATDAENLEKARTDDFCATGLGDLLGRWGRSLLVGASLVYGAYQGVGNNIEYSDGVMVGMVNKMSERGLFWKSYEGQMALEGIVSSGGSSGANVRDFSIDRQAWHGENPVQLAEKLRGYAEAGTKVKVEYKQPFAIWPWRAGTTYLVQRVEPVEKK